MRGCSHTPTHTHTEKSHNIESTRRSSFISGSIIPSLPIITFSGSLPPLFTLSCHVSKYNIKERLTTRDPPLSHTIFLSLALELLDPTFYNVLRRERVSASVGVFQRLIDALPLVRPARRPVGADRGAGGQCPTRTEPLGVTHTDTVCERHH